MSIKETQNKRTPREPASKKEMTSRMLTVPEAAAYLSSPVYSVRKLIWDRSLPVIKVGKGYLIDKFEIDAWIERTKSHL